MGTQESKKEGKKLETNTMSLRTAGVSRLSIPVEMTKDMCGVYQQQRNEAVKYLAREAGKEQGVCGKLEPLDSN